MAIAYYGAEISPHMTRTPEGYLICREVPINRTGDQTYLARDLQLDGDPEREVTVHRYPEDVFDPAALASFECKDVTAGHPPENLTPETYMAYSKGHVENVRRVGDRTVADLCIKDRTLISDIEAGVVREVSCGYLCTYEPDGDGYRQTNIRGNHVAVVPRGRAGHDIAIKDAAPAQGIAAAAKKGSQYMADFFHAILKTFGMAAKDASPEELDSMTAVAAEVLDALPAETPETKPPAAEPAEETDAADVMVERAPKGDDLGSKLDKILALLESRGRDVKPALTDERDLDKAIAALSGESDPEAAVTVPAEEMEDNAPRAATPCVKDEAAANLLKALRPAVAQISDRSQRAKVVDALLGAMPGSMAGIMKAAADSAHAKASSQQSYEKVCAEAESAYAARNPHKKKEA